MIDERILDTYFARGLIAGLGSIDDRVCLEVAIALAHGEELTDAPSCVSPVDRTFWIEINDSPWSSPEARAKALRPAVIPQLGTTGRDRLVWIKAVMLGMIQEVLPLALRAVAEAVPDHTAPLLAAAEQCVVASNLLEAAEATTAVETASARAEETSLREVNAAGARAEETSLREVNAAGAVKTTKIMKAAAIAAAAAEAARAARIATEMLGAVWTTQTAATEMLGEVWTTQAAATVAKVAATVAKATSITADVAKARDTVLRAAVVVGLRAYKQTA